MMVDLKPYPDFICSDCFVTANRSLREPHWHHSFKKLGDDDQCEMCGQHKPLEECSYLGYPIFEGYIEPDWSPADDDYEPYDTGD